jgi:hypothetical protein
MLIELLQLIGNLLGRLSARAMLIGSVAVMAAVAMTVVVLAR